MLSSERVVTEERNVCVGVALGTASVLGLANVKMLERPTTAHLMVGGQCVNNCAFCPQAHGSKGTPHRLSRVTWPVFDWAQLGAAMREALDSGVLKRVCIQLVESPEGTRNALAVLKEVRSMSQSVPVSVCMAPYSVARVQLFMDSGASQIGLPLDAVSDSVYRRVKHGSIERAWAVLERCASMWPGRISTHLIVGLGETEEDIVRAVERACSMGVRVALFAFTPVRGTSMERAEPPDIGSYRRIQLATYILARGYGSGCIKLDRGRIVEIALPDSQIAREVAEGAPFETSGCPDCNRPYYNERPGGTMMNFPRKLSRDEVRACLRESGIFREVDEILEAQGDVSK